jgi:hypothetical protein
MSEGGTCHVQPLSWFPGGVPETTVTKQEKLVKEETVTMKMKQEEVLEGSA